MTILGKTVLGKTVLCITLEVFRSANKYNGRQAKRLNGRLQSVAASSLLFRLLFR